MYVKASVHGVMRDHVAHLVGVGDLATIAPASEVYSRAKPPPTKAAAAPGLTEDLTSVEGLGPALAAFRPFLTRRRPTWCSPSTTFGPSAELRRFRTNSGRFWPKFGLR